MPALWNISQLLFLLMYMFAVLGMVLFSETKENGPMADTHFKDISSAMLTMLRVSTGENWHELMFALGRSNSPMYECIEDPTYQDFVDNDYEPIGCGSKGVSIAFFVIFVIMVSLVFLNLFIAVIL